MLEHGTANPNQIWLSAFPSQLQASVKEALSRLPKDDHPPAAPFCFRLLGEDLLIPYRLYKQKPDVTHVIREVQQIIACMYTRHHDGFVREEYLRQFFKLHDDWMVPYVIQLLGEYVPSIHQLMLAQRPVLRSEVYMKVYEENADFIERTKSRIISYWACYYRDTPLEKYPAFQVAEALGWWKVSDLRSLR